MFAADPFANIRRLVQTPAHLMRTFELRQPAATHFRTASCREVGCSAYANGFRMGFDLSDPQKAAAARWIRDHSGRRMSAELTGAAPAQRVVLTFPAGQECFQTHRVPLEREPLMIARGGDFRGNPTGAVTRHTSADSFLDHWSSDLDKIHTVHERG